MSMNSYLRQPLPPPLLYGRTALSTSIPSRYDLEPFDPPLDHSIPYAGQSRATLSLPRGSQVMSSTTRQTSHKRGPSGPFTDCSTPYVKQYETTPSLPRGSQVILGITEQSMYNPRPFSPFVDRPATQVEPSRYVYVEQGDAYNTVFHASQQHYFPQPATHQSRNMPPPAHKAEYVSTTWEPRRFTPIVRCGTSMPHAPILDATFDCSRVEGRCNNDQPLEPHVVKVGWLL
jgi:hypothetical protein